MKLLTSMISGVCVGGGRGTRGRRQSAPFRPSLGSALPALCHHIYTSNAPSSVLALQPVTRPQCPLVSVVCPQARL